MTFEDAIKSLGAEFGAELKIADGVAAFTAFDDGEDGLDVVLRPVENRECVDISADLGALPPESAKMLEMLEANHMFGGTGGASLSIEGDRAQLERRVSLAELGRGEGAFVLAPFIATAREWREKLKG